MTGPVDWSVRQICAAARGREIGVEQAQTNQVLLANCPFHSLAQEHTELVCGMNEALLSGVCESVGGISAHLDPGEDRCCVLLRAQISAPRRSQ